MDTIAFLEKILPTAGVYVLAEFRRGLGKDKFPSHTTFETITDLAARAQWADQQGWNVFHACSSFVTADLSKIAPNAKGKPAKSPRVARNAAWVRSQWLDVDVGGDKDYPDKRSALRAVVDLTQQLGIPMPLIVVSGRGLHCYWCFDRNVPASTARRGMRAFANALTDAGFAHDPSRTCDLASVLRPVGTHHRKSTPREVTLLRDAEPIDPDTFYASFSSILDTAAAPPPIAGDDEWGTGQVKEYPPSEARKIYQHCGALREVADVQGDVSEPLWRNMLGLLRHCVEGLPLAKKWSKGHPQYDEKETEEKYENWGGGPTTCEQFSRCSSACAECPHYGKIKSPIHLGYADPEEQPVTIVNDSTFNTAPVEKAVTSKLQRSVITHSRKKPDQIPFWPKRYRWDSQNLSKFVKGMTDEEPGMWVPFMSKLVYPYMRYADEEGQMQLRCAVLVHEATNKWKEFDIPAKSLAENRAFNGALGAYEVYTMGDKGTVMARHFFQDVIGQMQELGIETQAHTNFGWHDGAFVIGTSAITGSKTEPVFLSDKIPSDARCDYGTAGTTEDWAQLIDQIYNRAGAEPYQFLICAGFGAPLVSLAGSELWHGIPIALTGEGGLGKSTTCLVACSMYGKPGRFMIHTNDLGTTMNALISRVGLMRHLPLVLDEMTGRKTDELQAMLYALSNGKPKERNRADGSLIDANNRWDTTTFITGNMNITSMLAQLDKNRAEATQLRCFEIPLDDGFNDRVFTDLNAKDMIEHKLLANNYGMAGREYLQYIIRNEKAVTAQLQKLRAKFTPNSREETRERFYYDCVATALVGGAIAKKLGLIDFDLSAIKKWALQHIKSLRTNRVSSLSTVEDYLADFLASLHGRTVTTETFADGRSGIKYEVDSKEVRWPIARIARQDKKFYVAHKHLVEWCGERNIHAKWFKDELDKRGLLVPCQGQQTVKTSIFKGTSLPSSQTTCIELDYDRLLGAAAGTNLHAVNTTPVKTRVGRPKKT